ncbi:hypothetical protein MSPP1_002081 [Malassezia sp. CBS 17886]|nr:hypothetical protein MSPP1_002081 [Malassezia sp. CBS 17886]
MPAWQAHAAGPPPFVKRTRTDQPLGTIAELEASLHRLEGRPYGAYHDLEGAWVFAGFTFILDRAQSDPYAAPSKARIRIPHGSAGFPASMYSSHVRQVAMADYLLRALFANCTSHRFHEKLGSANWSGGKGGQLEVDRPGQQVLERTAVVVDTACIEVRFLVGLPARGRNIMGGFAATVLCKNVPVLVEESLVAGSLDLASMSAHIDCVEDQEALRAQLGGLGLVGFVANGAILPRASGASELPLAPPACVPFESPASQEVELHVPHRGAVRGLGIRRGAIYMCVGGGYHGKSTFLAALSLGSYNHVRGDGREFVSTVDTTYSVGSEDGRAVQKVDISPFITNLPNGTDTGSFSTMNASGSTSCAAALMEAREIGAELLLCDEDSTASNFLVRDAAMQELVPVEPITPLVARAKELVDQTGSTLVLVCGSSSAFLPLAHAVLQLDAYRMLDVTERVQQVLATHQVDMVSASAAPDLFAPDTQSRRARELVLGSLAPPGKTSTRSRILIQYGADQELSLRTIPQLVHTSQTRAIESLLRRWGEGTDLVVKQGLAPAPAIGLRPLVTSLGALMSRDGVEVIMEAGRQDGFLARPRAIDVAAADLTPVNRLRQAQWKR